MPDPTLELAIPLRPPAVCMWTYGLYKGTIESYDRETGYRVQFSDELVDYGILEVRGMLLPADQ